MSLELISIHLPKTAGSTFREHLQRHCQDELLTIYDSETMDRFFQQGSSSSQTNSRIRVIHGHFPVGLAQKRFPDARTAIWFRDPVDRMIPYFYYWLETPPHGNPNHQRFLAERPSLEEFVRLAAHEVPGYLASYRVRDFDFIGLVENFNEDLHRFEQWMQSGFCTLPVPRRLRRWLPLLGGFAVAPGLPMINKTQHKPFISRRQRRVLAGSAG